MSKVKKVGKSWDLGNIALAKVGNIREKLANVGKSWQMLAKVRKSSESAAITA